MSPQDVTVASKPDRNETNEWLRSFGLKPKEEVAFYCHEPHIQHGYRCNPTTVRYCFSSIFHPTNETLNVWTHALPCVFLLWFNISFAVNNFGQLSWTDSVFYPYWFFVFGVTITLLGSAGAHMFNCVSPGVREACFCCDYGFISLEALGVTCCFTFYVCPFTCFGLAQDAWFFPYLTILFGNIITVATACYTRYPRVPYRNLFRVLPFAAMFTLLNVPCLYKYSADGTTFARTQANTTLVCNLNKSPALSHNFYMLCLSMLTGVVLQASKVPERFFPGKFDIVGHSHQIFHLFTALGIYYQAVVIQTSLREVINLRLLSDLSAEKLNITLFTGLHIPLLVTVLSIIVSLCYSYDLYRKCAQLHVKIQ